MPMDDTGAGIPSSGRQAGPIPSPGFQSTPNGLIPKRYPILSGSAPELTIRSWLVFAQDANRS